MGERARCLKSLMVKQGISMSELASALGMHRATLYRKIRADCKNFTVKEAEAAEKVLHMSTDDSLYIFLGKDSHIASNDAS